MTTHASTMPPEMATWIRLNSPGPMHEHLRPLIGTWSAASKLFCDPDGPPQEATGTMRTDLLMGGRFLHSTYAGDSKERPFAGISILAYNNALGRYEGTWIDSMSTGIMFSTGAADPAGRVVTMNAELNDPGSGRVRRIKTVTSIVTNDRNTYEMFERLPGGSERKTLEVIYTRKR